MKKKIYLVVALLLCVTFALTACGKKEDKIICGVTLYDPMNYKDSNGDWTGFDTEFALLVGEKLDMDVEFQEIKWEYKYSELESGSINCIWNGFTANSSESDGTERKDLVDFSYSYMKNQQCIVVKSENADKYNTLENLSGKTAAAEKGSAGEPVADEIVGDNGKVMGASAQVDTLTEVKSGAVDFVVMDILLAQSLVGQGSYDDLVIADIELDSEVYAIGFKKDSELKDKVNKAMKELYDDGKLEELAEKYGLENSLVLDTDFKG